MASKTAAERIDELFPFVRRLVEWLCRQRLVIWLDRVLPPRRAR